MSGTRRALHGTDHYQPDQEQSANGSHVFHRVLVGSHIATPRPRPKLHANVFYPRKTHALTGEPEAGKSTVGIWALLEAVALGHPAVLVDSEAGLSHTADLLQSFGADPARLDELLHYFPHPKVRWHDGHIAELHDLLAEVQPKIAMFDSSARMLSAAGLNENDASHVTRLWDHVLGPIAELHGCTVIVTDHDSKDGFASRYGRGSTAKLAAVDVQIKLAVVQPFSRDQDGTIDVLVTKDRPGCLHRAWQISVTRDPLTLDWARSRPPAAGGEPTFAAEKIAEVLSYDPAPINELVDRIVARGGKPLKAATARKALAYLLEIGGADKIDQSPGLPTLWLLPTEPEAEPEPEPARAPDEPQQETLGDQG